MTILNITLLIIILILSSIIYFYIEEKKELKETLQESRQLAWDRFVDFTNLKHENNRLKENNEKLTELNKRYLKKLNQSPNKEN